MTRDTVMAETPASRATSYRVAAPRSFLLVSMLPGGGGPWRDSVAGPYDIDIPHSNPGVRNSGKGRSAAIEVKTIALLAEAQTWRPELAATSAGGSLRNLGPGL